MTEANKVQVGGNHYKSGGIEHWDTVVLFELDYFQGQIWKYVLRWRSKGGIQDLKKAQHVLQKYIEIEELKIAQPEQYKQKLIALLMALQADEAA